MISQRIANLIFAFVLISLSAWMAWIAWGFKTPPLGDATLPTKFFPLVLIGFIVICILVYAREYLIHGESGGDKGENLYQSARQAKTGMFTLLSVVLSFVIWTRFGFLIAGLISPLLIAFSMGTRRPLHFAIICCGAGLTYVVFTHLLGTQFR